MTLFSVCFLVICGGYLPPNVVSVVVVGLVGDDLEGTDLVCLGSFDDWGYVDYVGDCVFFGFSGDFPNVFPDFGIGHGFGCNSGFGDYGFRS
jgi:hypothetical protein